MELPRTHCLRSQLWFWRLTPVSLKIIPHPQSVLHCAVLALCLFSLSGTTCWSPAPLARGARRRTTACPSDIRSSRQCTRRWRGCGVTASTRAAERARSASAARPTNRDLPPSASLPSYPPASLPTSLPACLSSSLPACFTPSAPTSPLARLLLACGSVERLDAGLLSCRWCQHILHSLRAPEKALWNSTQARTPFTRICHLPGWTSMILQRGDTIRELKSSFFCDGALAGGGGAHGGVSDAAGCPGRDAALLHGGTEAAQPIPAQHLQRVEESDRMFGLASTRVHERAKFTCTRQPREKAAARNQGTAAAAPRHGHICMQ